MIKDARRSLLPRFPYSLCYVISDEIVIILAVAHHRREPDYWHSRLPS
jgi:toxin ParE1/3/4